MRETFTFFTCIKHFLFLLQTIITLNLQLNKIGDVGAQVICKALETKTLTTLDLHVNNIGNAGAQAIGQALERNQVKYRFSFFMPISDLLSL